MKKNIHVNMFATASVLMLCACGEDVQKQADREFFGKKHGMLTAVWTEPFSYDEVRSNNAPKGPFLGNGDVGVVCNTTAASQTVQLGKVDFVTDGLSDWAGSGAAALGVGGVSIEIEDSTGEGFRYEMDQLEVELRMTTGTINPVQMTTWMSVNDNYVVTELRTEASVPLTVNVETYASDASERYAVTADVRDGIAQVTRRTRADEGMRWVSQVGVSTCILGSTSASGVVKPGRVSTTFMLTDDHPVYVVAYVSGGGTDDDARLDEAYEVLEACDTGSIKKLKQEKADWWEEMWTRSYVETNDSLLDRHYLSSIYLMASAHNSHTPACGGMYGVWNMEDDMMYHGDIHLNYNSQAGFYSMFSANRPELSLSYFDFLERMIPEGRRRAREEMGQVHPSLQGKSCRGLLFPVSALGIGSFYCTYWQQTVDAPFNVPLFCWYYEYTGDTDFLRERAYPFLRECGDFYEDYLQKEDYGASYRYCITTGAHEGSWDLNPSSDLAFVELTFDRLLRYSEVLGMDADRRVLWQDILSHLPEYKVIMPTMEPNQGLPVYAKNEAGWDLPAHLIQMHPVYPCEILNLHSDGTELQIARNTIYYYGVSHRGFTETMNELGLSAFVMGARVGFSPEILVDKMKVLIGRAGKNFLIRDGHHCLEKTTVVETINSMMLQSVDSVLYLFPCWTPTPASFTRLRAKGAFIVSAKYDGKEVTTLQIKSELGNECRLHNPWPGCNVSVTENGKPVAIEHKDGICTFLTKRGGIYDVTPMR